MTRAGWHQRTENNLHESKLTLLTNAMWTPRRRCEPEHSRHTNAPSFSVPGGAPGGGTIKDAQVGLFSGQSEQT